MTEFNSCPADGAHKEVNDSISGVSRRSFLTKIAIAAGTVGLSSIGSSALASHKKYKICSTKDIKVGGGSIFKIAGAGGLQVLITQPKSEVFRAFNPACTHEGFPIGSISGTNMICKRHGATFDTSTGKATRGPANIPLQKYTLTVENKNIFITLSS